MKLQCSSHISTLSLTVITLALATVAFDGVEAHRHKNHPRRSEGGYHPTPGDPTPSPPHHPRPDHNDRSDKTYDRAMDAVTIAIPLVLLAVTVLSLVLCACCCKRLQRRSDEAEAAEYDNRVSVISRNQRSWNSEIMGKITAPPVYEEVVEHPGMYGADVANVHVVGNPGVSGTAPPLVRSARPSYYRSVSGTSQASQVSLPPSYDAWMALQGSSVSPSGSTDQLIA